MQTLEEKARAIASVLWLLEDHYRMIAAGRLGSCINYVRQLDGSERWRPPILEEFEDWPVNHVMRWLHTYRYNERRYRLRVIVEALQMLREAEPKQEAAVWACYVEIPPPFEWYSDLQALADDGLLFLAAEVRGDVPEWSGPHPIGKKDLVLELINDGRGTREIAAEVGCSTGYVRRLKRTVQVRPECTPSAVG